MDELELVRLHEDGDRLVVIDPDGAEHTLPITDALRAVVRGDRPRTATIRVDEELAMRPRDIQARLRAGATADDLAAESGMPPEQIRRFEHPVASEREHAVGRVREKAVMSEDGGAATIGDLADKRLRDRGSDPVTVRWTATRDGIAPWVVTLTFRVDAGERTARWSFDPRGGAVIALDDEARWLALPEDDGTPVSRTVTALPPSRGYGRATADDDETDLLLDGLSERRGHRPHRSPEPADIDAGELGLDDLSPRRHHSDPATPGAGTPLPATPGSGTPSVGTPGSGALRPGSPGDTFRSPAEPENSTDAEEPTPASIVDLGSRRGKHSTGRSDAESPDPSHVEEQLEWDGPSQWEISSPDRDDERRPRTAALRTGGPLTGAVPKALRPATAGSIRPENGQRPTPRSTTGTPADDDPDGHDGAYSPEDGTDSDHAKSARRRSARRGRAQVPSWDEIVFGSRPEG